MDFSDTTKVWNSVDVKNAIKKINDIEADLNENFLERDKEINMLLLGLISGTNCFLHGPAGTGKSLLTEELSKRITNSNYFRILMGKTTEPAEIFGPVSITALKNDSYKVITDNKLPRAEIAFLDEVFKANSAVLNGLLTIMNEKLFFNDVVEKVPTISVIGASNEYPEDDSLTALYDRFLLRWPVNYIQNKRNKLKLFTNFLDSRKTSNAKENNIKSIDITEIRALIDSAKNIEIRKDILLEYINTLNTIERDLGISISDRRKNENLKILQASALKRGRFSVELEDFDSLIYSLWEKEEDINIISAILSEISDPVKTLIESCKNEIKEFRKEIKEVTSAYYQSPDIENDDITHVMLVFTKIGKKISNNTSLLKAKQPTLDIQSRNKIEEIFEDYKEILNEIRDSNMSS